MEIKNKTIVITGAGSGIGKECAELLSSYGANIAIVDIDIQKANAACESIIDKGFNALSIKADVSDSVDVEHMVKNVKQVYGNIDILINNAAKQTVNNFFDLTEEEWKNIINTNLTGVFLCSQIVGKEMKNGGHIINMLSVHYEIPRLNKFHYDASKAGVAILTKEMALALVEHNINVNAISYGAVNTSMNYDWINDKEKVSNVLNNVPLKKILEPTEIAKFTYVILSELSEYTTGSIFTIDGGRSLK